MFYILVNNTVRLISQHTVARKLLYIKTTAENMTIPRKY